MRNFSSVTLSSNIYMVEPGSPELVVVAEALVRAFSEHPNRFPNRDSVNEATGRMELAIRYGEYENTAFEESTSFTPSELSTLASAAMFLRDVNLQKYEVETLWYYANLNHGHTLALVNKFVG